MEADSKRIIIVDERYQRHVSVEELDTEGNTS
jgi:hypothetical protein